VTATIESTGLTYLSTIITHAEGRRGVEFSPAFVCVCLFIRTIF